MTTPPFHDDPPQCPQCGTPGPLPLIYGNASEEMRIAAELGHLVLAHHQEPDAHTEWICRAESCQLRF
jgi:hypothetical protein